MDRSRPGTILELRARRTTHPKDNVLPRIANNPASSLGAARRSESLETIASVNLLAIHIQPTITSRPVCDLTTLFQMSSMRTC